MKNKINEEKIESNNTKILNKKDIIIMLIITLIYSVVAFINLGSFTNPQTFWKARECRRKCNYKNKK